MRLFAALTPPPEAVAHLRAAVDALPVGPDLRWTPPEQWHLTLTFLGEVAEPAAEQVVARFARVATRRAVGPVRFARGGRFGNRVLWVGVEGDRAGVSALAASLGAQARHVGLPVEDRPYRPHLTLARSRGGGADLRAAVGALAGYAGPWWTPDALRLVRSHLGSGPARHETLQAWPLA